MLGGRGPVELIFVGDLVLSFASSVTYSERADTAQCVSNEGYALDHRTICWDARVIVFANETT